MQHRERGAAHINIYFFLVLFVVFIGTLWFGYMQLGKNEALVKAAEDAETAKVVAERDKQHLEHYIEDITKVIGADGDWNGRDGYVWKSRFNGEDPAALKGVAVPSAVKAKLEALAKKLSIPTTSATPIAPFAGLITGLYEEQVAKVATANKAVTAAQDQVATLRSGFATTDQANTAKYQTLNSSFNKRINDLVDANNQAAARMRSAQDEVKKTNTTLDQMRDDHKGVVKAYNKEKQKLKSQMDAWRALNSMRRSPQLADGAVISASSKASVGWIDIGRKDMLQRGTKFRITNPAGTKVKGYGEVIGTEQERAEIRLYNVADSLADPISKGDKIYNDLYSPNMKRNVAMIGRFSYPYNKPMLKKLLENLGNTVHDDVKVGVDMVIVGLREPTESGEALKPVEDTPGYKEAQNLHCEIVTIERIRDLLKLGK